MRLATLNLHVADGGRMEKLHANMSKACVDGCLNRSDGLLPSGPAEVGRSKLLFRWTGPLSAYPHFVKDIAL